MINPAQIIGLYPPSRRLYVKYSSDVARFILQDDFALSLRDPTCIPVVDETNILGEALQVAVQANFRGGSEDRIEELSAALRACFPWQPGLLACRRYRGLPQVNSSGVGTITTDQLHPSGRPYMLHRLLIEWNSADSARRSRRA
jgi:hypothetical protein